MLAVLHVGTYPKRAPPGRIKCTVQSYVKTCGSPVDEHRFYHVSSVTQV